MSFDVVTDDRGRTVVVLALRDLWRVADAYADKRAVATWLRVQEARLVAEGYGPDDVVEITVWPDAEVSN